MDITTALRIELCVRVTEHGIVMKTAPKTPKDLFADYWDSRMGSLGHMQFEALPAEIQEFYIAQVGEDSFAVMQMVRSMAEAMGGIRL